MQVGGASGGAAPKAVAGCASGRAAGKRKAQAKAFPVNDDDAVTVNATLVAPKRRGHAKNAWLYSGTVTDHPRQDQREL